MSVFRKQTSRKGSVVYEQVLQKNFEIIETFLKKFHQIFTKQQQFQQHLNKFGERFVEYDEVLEQFRQQQRLNFVMLQKKVNNMKSSVRDSHRTSHRFSKINLPIFQANQTAQGGKNFTLLKFDCIENSNASHQQITQPAFQQKQTQQISFTNKQFEEVQQSISSIHNDIFQLRQKNNFLSAYTSSISTNDSMQKTKFQTMKKQIIEQIHTISNAKIEKQIAKKIVQTQKIFIQQINNLAIDFQNSINNTVDMKFENWQLKIKQLKENTFSKQQAMKMTQELNSQLKGLGNQCMNAFANKEETRRSFTLMDKKFRYLENNLKEEFIKSQVDKQQMDHFHSLLKVNSNSNNSRLSTCTPKASKSQSQFIKHRNNISSSALASPDDQDYLRKARQSVTTMQNKQNNLIEQKIQTTSKANSFHSLSQSSGLQLSKFALFTSKVSKQFMKNFGLNRQSQLKSTLNHTNKNKKLTKGYTVSMQRVLHRDKQQRYNKNDEDAVKRQQQWQQGI